MVAHISAFHAIMPKNTIEGSEPSYLELVLLKSLYLYVK